jgi:outer membrane protein TolC
VGGVLSVPLTNETADARYVQSKIALRRAKTNLRIQEQDVVLDVRTAVRELQNSIDGVKAAQRARIASAETLRAEQERLRLGDATPHDVLEFDTLLREAESSEIRALQVYRSAIVALERAQGTLLESTGIRVEDERDRGIVQEFGPQK